jgi:hypothetical protein
MSFEVESLQGRHIRSGLARSVVNAGWNLSELRPVGLSLEEIFLQLTAAEAGAEKKADNKAEKPDKKSGKKADAPADKQPEKEAEAPKQ